MTRSINVSIGQGSAIINTPTADLSVAKVVFFDLTRTSKVVYVVNASTGECTDLTADEVVDETLPDPVLGTTRFRSVTVQDGSRPRPPAAN